MAFIERQKVNIVYFEPFLTFGFFLVVGLATRWRHCCFVRLTKRDLYFQARVLPGRRSEYYKLTDPYDVLHLGIDYPNSVKGGIKWDHMDEAIDCDVKVLDGLPISSLGNSSRL